MKLPSEIKLDLLKKWESGRFYSAIFSDDIFPYSFPLKKLKDDDFKNNLDSILKWTKNLESSFNKPGITFQKKSVKFRLFGNQTIPNKIIFENAESLSRYLGKYSEYNEILNLVERTKKEFPEIHKLILDKPKLLLDNISIWNDALIVCNYISNHEYQNKYIRELAIPNIDTKFIEGNKKLFRTLFDAILNEDKIDFEYTSLASYSYDFEKRYGFKYNPSRIRLRLLDQQIRNEYGGISDIEINADEFDSFLNNVDCYIDNVYITENKINGLIFPDKYNSIVIFGLGYGVDTLKDFNFLKSCNIEYWGDIDTHGFAILSRLRSYFPKAKSFLMDEDTFNSHKRMAVTEYNKHKADSLPFLNEAEQNLYKKLKNKENYSRLEQEKINFDYLIDYLKLKK